MLFPISDDDSRLSGVAYVTWTLIALNAALFVLQMVNPEFTYAWSMVPYEVTTGTDLVEPVAMGNGQLLPHYPGPPILLLTLFSSMFMHGGLAHLGGNMLYLWIFGDNIEHRFGSVRFILFYLASGLGGHAAQIALAPESVIPNLGASGAISGIMGAYLVLFPRNRVNAVVFYMVMSVPALVVLGFWIATQVFMGAQSLGSSGGGVAYGAHIGGFLVGVLIALPFRLTMKREPESVLRRQYDQDPRARRYW